jgi:hypothetical protein
LAIDDAIAFMLGCIQPTGVVWGDHGKRSKTRAASGEAKSVLHGKQLSFPTRGAMDISAGAVEGPP